MLTYTLSERDVYGDNPVPEGYEVIDFRPPIKGELLQGVSVACHQVMPAEANFKAGSPRRILRKKTRVRYIVELLDREPMYEEPYVGLYNFSPGTRYTVYDAHRFVNTRAYTVRREEY